MNREENYNQDSVSLNTDNINENSHEDLDTKELTSELEKTTESDAELILDSVPVEVRDKIEKEVLSVSQYRYSGPIPHPDLLREFNDIIPNGADRILKMTEVQSKHRQEIEKLVITAKNRDSRNGVYFAGLIGIIAIIGTIVLIAIDKTFAGLIVGGGTLGSLVGIYIKGTYIGEKDLDEKKQSIKENQSESDSKSKEELSDSSNDMIESLD
ncbi:DUF2335 domain-containing protein [Aerococcaceae bacterium WGS1372]